MPSQDKNRIENLKERIQNVNNAKIRSETQLEELRKQRDTILARLAELGVDPNSLGTQIEQMKQQLEIDLANIEAQIPEGF
jgi:chromosome segregation ATPase